MDRLHKPRKGEICVRTSRQGMQGVTLVELMVTVAVLAIIASIATPSFVNLTRRSRLVSSGNEVVAMLQLAKMEAIRTNGLVEVCPTTDGETCSGANWRRIVVISRKNGADAVMRVADLNNALVAQGNAAVVAAGNKIGFGADGVARVGANVRSGGVVLCMPKLPVADNALSVDVNVSRVVVTRISGACS